MAYDLETMLVRVTGWNDDLNAGFATIREMKVMAGSFGQKVVASTAADTKVLGL